MVLWLSVDGGGVVYGECVEVGGGGVDGEER